MLKACHRYNVNNFVFASTAAVYGDAKELPIREDHILEPLSPYGNSKKLAEQYVNSFKKLKKIKNAVILRIFNPYGHSNANDPDVVTKFALSLKRKLPPIIYGNGNQTRDFISVDDIVDSILLSIDAMENTDKAKEDKKSILDSESIFNIGTGRSISINDLANKMIAISGLDLHPTYEKSFEIMNDVTHSYADISRSEKILHFVAKKRIETGVKEVMEKVCIE